MLSKMAKCNTLTICQAKAPEHYLRVIRYHFANNPSSAQDTLCLQALGMSCPNLVYVAELVVLKGYAVYKKIKNDNLSVPILDSATGNNIGMVKKVRLTIKLTRSPRFEEIVAQEEAEWPKSEPIRKVEQLPFCSEEAKKGATKVSPSTSF